MSLMQQLLLYGSVALCVFFILDSFFHFFSNVGDRGEQRVKRRLGPSSYAQSMIDGRDPVITRKKHRQEEEGFFVDRYLRNLLLAADNDIPVYRLYIFMALIAAVFWAVLTFFVQYLPIYVSLLISIIIGCGSLIFVLKGQAQKRLMKFDEQFPDALELIVRNLRVGRPLGTAIKAVADEMPDPIGKEFYIVSQDIIYGQDLPVAIKGMMRRINLANLSFFVVAVQIHSESGGNLAEILEGLSKIIRARFKLMRKVGSLTAEGRFSAWFLSAFPIIMIFVMNVVSPGYYAKVADYPLFPHLCAVVAVMLVVNVIAMRIITNLKV